MLRLIRENPELRNLIYKMAAVFLLVILLAVICSNYIIQSLNRSLIRKDLAIIGALVAKHPALKEDIIASFTKKPSAIETKQGLDIAWRYGYTEDLPLALTPVTVRFASINRYLLVFLFLFSGGVFILILFIELQRIYLRFREISLAAERIVEGDFSQKLEEENEGDLAKLRHHFNLMSKRLELTVEQLQAEKIFLKEIISDISHQLKTPLAALKMFNELLLEGSTVTEEIRKEFLGGSAAQIERMEWLIKNLLKMAKIEAKAIDFNDKYQPLLPAIMETINCLKFDWEKKRQSLRIVEQQTGIRLKYDRSWLSEAISNIIKNGIEHTPEGGAIKVELTESPVMINIIIQDNGTGIPPADLPHIFERFYKGSNSNPTGTGIGLALAKMIIENEGGLIHVKSEVGRGTTFTITFPKGVI